MIDGIRESLLVRPGQAADIRGRDPGDRLGLEGRGQTQPMVEALALALRGLQERLWAEARRSLLVVLQGLDTSGKDGTIRHVFQGVNPQGCRVASFKVPTATELAHDYLWRVHAVCPARGEIGIFNRSHYEDVLVVRVKELVPKAVWRRRYRHVRELERILAEEGTTIVKVFLHISSDEQRQRLQARIDDPEKRWKFRAADLEDRALWDAYTDAYEDALTKTSTDWAPWYVVPADRKWVRNAAVASILVATLRELDPRLPEPAEDLSGIVVE